MKKKVPDAELSRALQAILESDGARGINHARETIQKLSDRLTIEQVQCVEDAAELIRLKRQPDHAANVSEILVVARQLASVGLPHCSERCLLDALPSKLGQSEATELLQIPNSHATLKKLVEMGFFEGATIVDFVKADLKIGYRTAAADWIIQTQNLGAWKELLGIYLEGETRPDALPDPRSFLASQLRKDSKGKLIESLLGIAAASEGQFRNLEGIVFPDEKVLRRIVKNLPVALQSRHSSAGSIQLLRSFANRAAQASGKQRDLLTALLASLGCELALAATGSEMGNRALKLIRDSSRKLRSLTVEDSDRANTWLFELAEKPANDSEDSEKISPEAIPALTIALENAADGFGALEVVEVLAANLGLQSVGTIGEQVEYEPSFHADVEGGLLPGDPVTLIGRGWKYQQKTVVKAPVKYRK